MPIGRSHLGPISATLGSAYPLNRFAQFMSKVETNSNLTQSSPLSLEGLLRAVVEASIELQAVDLEQGVRSAVRRLGELTGMHRVYVVRFDADRNAGYFMAEHCAPGVSSVTSTTGPGPYSFSEYREVLQPLMHNQTYSSPIAGKSGANSDLNFALNTKSDVMVPIFSNGEFWGMIGFDDCVSTREFEEPEVLVLRGAAAAIAAAVERDMAEHQRRLERDRVARLRVECMTKTNEALRRSTSSLVTESDLDRFLCALMAEATAICGAKSAGVFTYCETTETLMMKSFMTEGRLIDIETSTDMEIWRGPVPTKISKPWVAQLKENEYAWFDNGTPLPDHPWPISLEWHRRLGHRFVVTLPLYAGNELVGTFGQCFTDESWRQTFNYEQSRILANYAALALQFVRLSAKTREVATQTAVLAERNRLARDIHDTLAQGFTGIIMQIEAAEEARLQGAMEHADHHLQLAQSLARQSLAEARRSVQALRPNALEASPLPSVLNKILHETFPSPASKAEFTCTGRPRPLRPIAEENLLRLVQEALHNTRKHAVASEVSVQLHFDESKLQLIIKDNGRGFDPSAYNDGFGMGTMRERAELLDGSLIVYAVPGVGTEIEVAIPAGSAYATP